MNNQKQIELPLGWQWVQLKDICRQDKRLIEPRTEAAELLHYVGLEHIESESGRFLVSEQKAERPVLTTTSVTFAFDNRHVLYSKLRPYLNKVALPHFRGRCTTELIPLLPTKLVSREYLALLLRREETVAVAMREKKGARMPRADVDKVLSLFVALPPIEYQYSIVERLDRQLKILNEARTAAEQQLVILKALPACLLKQALIMPQSPTEKIKANL